jgi:hypothetical protein
MAVVWAENAPRKDKSNNFQSYAQWHTSRNVSTRPTTDIFRNVSGGVHIRYDNYWRIIAQAPELRNYFTAAQ